MFPVSDIRRKVEKLKEFYEATGDAESAHGMEDELWESVLIDISQFSTDPIAKQQATEALETLKINFKRRDD